MAERIGTRGSELDDAVSTHLAVLLRLLADDTRLAILRILSHGEQNVGTLGRELKLTQPTVSHHLGLLRLHEVVSARRMGKQVFYRLNSIVSVEGGGVSIHTSRFDVQISLRAG
jgi:DNA-binding transcriptional ArsR family regulator